MLAESVATGVPLLTPVIANGALFPTNTTVDLFVGGNSTSSAKFAFINVNSGVATASISAGSYRDWETAIAMGNW